MLGFLLEYVQMILDRIRRFLFLRFVYCYGLDNAKQWHLFLQWHDKHNQGACRSSTNQCLYQASTICKTVNWTADVMSYISWFTIHSISNRYLNSTNFLSKWHFQLVFYCYNCPFRIVLHMKWIILLFMFTSHHPFSHQFCWVLL